VGSKQPSSKEVITVWVIH